MADCYKCLNWSESYGRCRVGEDPSDCEEYTTEAGFDAAMAGKGKWVSVKDALPDKDCATLILLKTGYVGICYFAGDWWGGYERDSITHWQYLPDPPSV